jgi:hypothetical protein
MNKIFSHGLNTGKHGWGVFTAETRRRGGEETRMNLRGQESGADPPSSDYGRTRARAVQTLARVRTRLEAWRLQAGFGLARDGGGANAVAHERANCFSEISDCAEGGTGDVLVVRVRAVTEPAVLRRIAQGNRVRPEAGGNKGSGDGGVVRVQTFGNDAVLRRDAFEALGLPRRFRDGHRCQSRLTSAAA